MHAYIYVYIYNVKLFLTCRTKRAARTEKSRNIQIADRARPRPPHCRAAAVEIGESACEPAATQYRGGGGTEGGGAGGGRKKAIYKERAI